MHDQHTNEATRLISDNPTQEYGSDENDPSDDINIVNHSAKWPQYLSALSATGGALAAGTVFGWSSPASAHLIGKDHEYSFDITEEQFSWISSAVALGAASVCIPIGFLIKFIGRKLTMLLLVIPFMLGWLLIDFAQNVPMMICGRFIVGFAGGAFCVTAPVYTAEIAEKEIRGSLGIYFQLMGTVGVLFVYVIGSRLSVFSMSIVCSVIPLVFGAIFFFMPETPLYLVSQGRIENAKQSLIFLRGKFYDNRVELHELETENAKLIIESVSTINAFKRKPTQKSLAILIGLMFFQQATGVNAIIFFTADIFKAANSGISKELSTIIVGLVQVVACFASTLVVDRLGRRLLLIISDAMITVCTLLLGLYFYVKHRNEESVQSIGWLPIISLCLFMVMFSLGYGPIPWLMLGELFTPDIKGVASSIGATFSWILAFCVTKSFSSLIGAIGLGETFWLFSALSTIGTIFTYYCVPETKGKSLHEIQRMLGAE